MFMWGQSQPSLSNFGVSCSVLDADRQSRHQAMQWQPSLLSGFSNF